MERLRVCLFDSCTEETKEQGTIYQHMWVGFGLVWCFYIRSFWNFIPTWARVEIKHIALYNTTNAQKRERNRNLPQEFILLLCDPARQELRGSSCAPGGHRTKGLHRKVAASSGCPKPTALLLLHLPACPRTSANENRWVTTAALANFQAHGH